MANKLSLYRGVTYPSNYQHTDGAGNKLPLTGCAVIMTIKRVEWDDDADDSDATFQAVVTSHTDAANGYTEWETKLDATGVEPGDYYYDITVRDASGKEAPPVIIGECEILGKRTNV